MSFARSPELLPAALNVWFSVRVMVPSSAIGPWKDGMIIGVSVNVTTSVSPTRSRWSVSGLPELAEAIGATLVVATAGVAVAVTGTVGEAGVGLAAGAAPWLAPDEPPKTGGTSANCCSGDCDRQPDRQNPAKTNPQTAPQCPNCLPTLLMLI